jgi:hypothetical protein
MTEIILAFQNMAPEEIAVLIIVGCIAFVIGVALG